MKYFVALSYQNRKNLAPVIDQVKTTLKEQGHRYDVYVEHQSQPSGPKEIMADALGCLDKCDGLLVEMSTKEVGIGIEMGHAVEAGMPIIGIRKKDLSHQLPWKACLPYPL